MPLECEHSPAIHDDPDQSRFSPILAENVKRMRVYSRINKKRFALMVDIGRPFLNKIESGTADARLSVLTKLADALGTTPDYLVRAHTDEEIRAEVDRRKDAFRAAESRHAQLY